MAEGESPPMELPVNVIFALIPQVVVLFRNDLRLPGGAPSAEELYESFRKTEPTLGEVWAALHPDLQFAPASATGKESALRYQGPKGYAWVLPETAQLVHARRRVPLLAIGKRERSGTFHFQSVRHLTDDEGAIVTDPKVHTKRVLSGIRMEFAAHVRRVVPEVHLVGFTAQVLDKWTRLED